MQTELIDKIGLANHGNSTDSMLDWSVLGRVPTPVAQFAQNRRSASLRVGSPKYLVISAALLVAYTLSAQLERLLPFWSEPGLLSLHVGITWGALLLWGYALWPAIFAGLCFTHGQAGAHATVVAGLSAADLLAGVAGIYLMGAFPGTNNPLSRVRHFVRLTAVSALISALAGGIHLGLSHALADFNWLNWSTACLTQLLGILVIAPSALTWTAAPSEKMRPGLRTIALLSGALMAILIAIIFGNALPLPAKLVLGGLCVILLATTPSQLEQREVAAGILLLGLISLVLSGSGYGPSAAPDASVSLLALQMGLSIFCVITLGISALVSEHRRSEEFLKKSRDELAAAAISDPLTGLSNYRHFIDVFNAEADRSRRTGRTFALVLFDLDNLKTINDTYGHLSGTHAICRVGNTMRVYCRNIDTAVRYGGDEFALVLPETPEAGAYEVARRISLQIANDGGTPAISVSFGITTFPDGGNTFEEIFGRADSALYEMKNRNKSMYRKLGSA